MTGLTYKELLQEFVPRPITSASALKRAYKLIDQLIGKAKLSRSESEMLEMLSILVEQYESTEHPTPELSPAELLEHFIEVHGVTRAEIARKTGIPRSTVGEIIAGHREISKQNIGRLATYFNVSPNVFIAKDTLRERRQRVVDVKDD